MMSGADVKLTIAPYSLSALPPEHALVTAGKTVLSTLDSWKKGKTFSNSQGKTLCRVRTLSRSKAPGEGAAWHARISEHTEGSFDDFWDGLGRDKALKEQEFIPELVKVTLLRSLSPTQILWTLQYKFTPPVSPRVFTVLQVTHLTGGDNGTPREGWIISVPVDVTEETHLKSKEEKGVKGRYVSIERVVEGKDGQVEWTMATSSTPGGRIPQFLAERTMPGMISKDVFHFVKWMSKKKDTGPVSDSAAISDDISPERPELRASLEPQSAPKEKETSTEPGTSAVSTAEPPTSAAAGAPNGSSPDK